MTEKRHGAAMQQEPGIDSMPIGEFDGAATLPGDNGILLSTPMYWLYEMGQAALNPSRAVADATRLFFKNPAHPFAHTTYGQSVAAAAGGFERSPRPPAFVLKNPGQPVRPPPLRQVGRRRGGSIRAPPPPLSPAGMGYR